MVLERVCEAEIVRAVNDLRGSSSFAPDRIPRKRVEFFLLVNLSTLTRLLNLSFENGVFQNALKFARVMILYKDRSQNDPTNCCPISLCQCLVNLFEKVCFLNFFIFLMPNIYSKIFSFALV